MYHGRISVELDPENPLTLGLYVEVLRVAGKCEEALHYGKKAYSIDTDNIFSTGRLRDAYICSGDYQSAFETWEKIKYNHWESLGVRELLEKTFHEQGWTAFIKELTRINKEIMELDPQELAYNMAHKYFLLGDYEKSMDNYEILFEINNHFPDLPYISCKPTYDKMKDNPKYLALLKNMNLPLTD